MVKIIHLIAILLFTSIVNAQSNINSTFSLKWKAKIGITTYRTNIIESDGFIYVASNGNDANSDNDPLDGVHQIEAKTGKTKYIFQSQLLGDNDATGIALYENKLYFGTDNYYFYCFDVNTKSELWKYPTPYDVESAPALADLNGDGINDVVFAVQQHGVYALDGKTGKEIWVNDSVSSHQGNVAPLLIDCNNDGVLDILSTMRGIPYTNETAGWKMAHYGDYHIALDGKSGKLLWASPTGAGVHSSYFPFKDDKGNTMICAMDCYGELQFITLDGKALKKVSLGYGHFMSPVMHNNNLVVGDFVIEIKDEYFDFTRDSSYRYLTNRAPTSENSLESNVSATTVVADVLGLGKQQYISVSENGEMSIRNEAGKRLKHLKFPQGAECSVFVKDIDGDGYLELLIASLDGYLYCYKTKSKNKTIMGQFRWNNLNMPIIK